MSIVCKCAGTLIMGIMMTGCATHNYDFAAVTNGPSRITQLVDDLDRIAAEERIEDEELYDLSLVPFVHSQLHVFAEVNDEDTPAAFIEADIESSLPLFGFVNGKISRYDINQHILTQHDFDSNFWGAFRSHRAIVGTRAGNRETTRQTFLWLFNLSPRDMWHPAAEVAPGDSVELMSNQAF